MPDETNISTFSADYKKKEKKKAIGKLSKKIVKSNIGNNDLKSVSPNNTNNINKSDLISN